MINDAQWTRIIFRIVEMDCGFDPTSDIDKIVLENWTRCHCAKWGRFNFHFSLAINNIHASWLEPAPLILGGTGKYPMAATGGQHWHHWCCPIQVLFPEWCIQVPLLTTFKRPLLVRAILGGRTIPLPGKWQHFSVSTAYRRFPGLRLRSNPHFPGACEISLKLGTSGVHTFTWFLIPSYPVSPIPTGLFEEESLLHKLHLRMPGLSYHLWVPGLR